jgi:hypothetical protein
VRCEILKKMPRRKRAGTSVCHGKAVCLESAEGASEFTVPAKSDCFSRKLKDKSEGVKSLGMHTTVTRPTRQWWKVRECRPRSGPADPSTSGGLRRGPGLRLRCRAD